jgi:nucleoside-diphosphate-sugar epimerase
MAWRADYGTLRWDARSEASRRGARFIGSHLVERLVALGEHVAVVDDLSRRAASGFILTRSFMGLTARDADALWGAGAVRRAAPEVVVHLAALHFIPALTTRRSSPGKWT